MGSCTNYSRLSAFHEKFASVIVEHYKYLIGHSIVAMSELDLGYYKSAEIELSNGESFATHFGWSSEEECILGEEVLNDDEMSTLEYFENYIQDKKIVKIKTGYVRDDMYYISLIVDYPDKNVHSLEIPFHFDVMSFELDDYSIISKEDFDLFSEQYFTSINS